MSLETVDKTQEVFLKDYKVPSYWVENIYIDIEILLDKTRVVSTTRFSQSSECEINSLALDGVDLELESVWIDGLELAKEQYQQDDKKLYLKDLPEKFELKTEVIIFPENNFSGEGLYRSGSIYCTQCEAQGFRRLTYFLDRPDVMSFFSTRISADKKRYPKLLSNGNIKDSGDLECGRHFVLWEDPFKKPAYLFALVAGDLALVQDTFQTKSNKKVDLEIYVDHGNEDKCYHAMESLKNSMKWDEDKFGLEYDLDIYMIVAVDSFNMGAMENKGLNIFNSAYVLAKKETATDRDFQGIEAVIGHEYFHNWTGNRVTCRDWFQLTLKEGLTVFRDQEFSSDMLCRAVKRVEDVSGLRSSQFPEDAGPLSHPIKPKSFMEINNFYTATIYDKGAEVIRMIHTLIGADKFREAMDLYFKRHDGEAVTTEDFISAMADTSAVDLTHFKVWYDQNGTPLLDIKSEYNKEKSEYKLIIEQKVKTNRAEFDSLHMPFHISLLSKTGKSLSIKNEGKFELKEKITQLLFSNIEEDAIPSLNENFTAPVNIQYDYSNEDLFTLVKNGRDEFTRYDAARRLAFIEIEKLTSLLKNKQELSVSERYLETYRVLLHDSHIGHAFKTYVLTLPTLKDINEKSEKYDFEYLPRAINFLNKSLAISLENEIIALVNELDQEGEYSLSAQAMGERAFKNFLLTLIYDSQSPRAFDLIYKHYKDASNMTDEIAALSSLAKSENPYRKGVLESFYNKWEAQALVMQKWLGIQVVADDCDVSVVQSLESISVYDVKIPNFVRALIANFANFNTLQLNALDGKGYTFFCDKIIEIDKLNPQIAAGLCKRLNFLNKLDDSRVELLSQELMRVKNSKGLSSDTLEVVSRILA